MTLCYKPLGGQGMEFGDLKKKIAPKGSGTIRRYGFAGVGVIGGSVSLCGVGL